MEAQIPDVKTGDKKKEEEKKKGGAFVDLFGSNTRTAFGARAGIFGPGGLGGLLSTKAGVIAAIAIGATVAGVLGLVGYKVFGPSRADRTASAISLFEPKPAADARREGGTGSNGNSDSLSQLASANQSPAAAKDSAVATDQAKADAPGAAASAPATDAADAAKAAAAAAQKAQAASASAGNVSRRTMPGGLQAKFGTMASSLGSGASGTSFAAATPVAAAKVTPSSAMSRSGAKPASRGLLGKRGFGSAGSQALGALKDQRGAITSQGAGATYDGAPVGSGIATPPASSGASAPASAPDANPSVGNSNGNGAGEFPAPPGAAAAANVTPWQNAINTAEMLLAAAAMLIFIASKGKALPGGGMVLANVAGGMAALLALMAASIGHQIATGPYGQVAQGNMFQAAGAFMAAGAVAMILSNTADKDTAELMKYVAYGSGAVGLGLGIMAAMTPKVSYPPSDFQYDPGGRAPDWNFGSGGTTAKQGCVAAPAGTPGC